MIVEFASNQSNLIGSYKIPVCFSFQTIGENPSTFSIARFLVSCFLIFNLSKCKKISFQNIIVTEDIETETIYAGKSPFTSNDWPTNIILVPPASLP